MRPVKNKIHKQTMVKMPRSITTVATVFSLRAHLEFDLAFWISPLLTLACTLTAQTSAVNEQKSASGTQQMIPSIVLNADQSLQVSTKQSPLGKSCFSPGRSFQITRQISRPIINQIFAHFTYIRMSLKDKFGLQGPLAAVDQLAGALWRCLYFIGQFWLQHDRHQHSHNFNNNLIESQTLLCILFIKKLNH